MSYDNPTETVTTTTQSAEDEEALKKEKQGVKIFRLKNLKGELMKLERR